MSSLTERLQNLSPEQRELLERRMRKRDRTTSASGTATAMSPPPLTTQQPGRQFEFSIFFFSADGQTDNHDRYRFLTEVTRFADHNGFAAVWTPERHFQSFGGLYPNPAVLSAALAMITERVQIRAGSVVLPLHSPVRVAEDWAVVDNLSGGRVAISCATGWHEHDYVIAPGNFEKRREVMYRNIDIVRRLWAGEEVEFPGVGGRIVPVRTLPRPVQPEMPIWVTVSSQQSWARAGEIGANVLTALGTLSLQNLGQSISIYRKARYENGHDPRTGIVSLMLHTFLGSDIEIIRDTVRHPLKTYLQSYLDQFGSMMGKEVTDPSSPEMQDLLELAFENYVSNSSLLGTKATCAAMIDKIRAVGVNEAACLVDFGIDLESTFGSLQSLAELRASLDTRNAMSADAHEESSS